MEVFNFLPSLSFHRGLTLYPYHSCTAQGKLHLQTVSVKGDSVATTQKNVEKMVG